MRHGRRPRAAKPSRRALLHRTLLLCASSGATLALLRDAPRGRRRPCPWHCGAAAAATGATAAPRTPVSCRRFPAKKGGAKHGRPTGVKSVSMQARTSARRCVHTAEVAWCDGVPGTWGAPVEQRADLLDEHVRLGLVQVGVARVVVRQQALRRGHHDRGEGLQLGELGAHAELRGRTHPRAGNGPLVTVVLRRPLDHLWA